MNSMREYSNISHNDAWTKHLKKLGQRAENTSFSVTVGWQNHPNHGLSRPSKWGK